MEHSPCPHESLHGDGDGDHGYDDHGDGHGGGGRGVHGVLSDAQFHHMFHKWSDGRNILYSVPLLETPDELDSHVGLTNLHTLGYNTLTLLC